MRRPEKSVGHPKADDPRFISLFGTFCLQLIRVTVSDVLGDQDLHTSSMHTVLLQPVRIAEISLPLIPQ